MFGSVSLLSLTRRLSTLILGALLLVAFATGTARATGILPPANPGSDCNAGQGMGLAAIDACRAQEGIGPLRLPTNWASLGPVEQGFVLINLERVNRGLPPIVGLTSPLNGLASRGAQAGTDPNFPANGFVGGGGIWAGSPSVLAADYLWMYVDGPGGDNLDCTTPGESGCWGHRDIILWNRTSGSLVSGGGFASAGGTESLAYLVLDGYPAENLTFSWATELAYFPAKPGLEPLGHAAQARRHKKHRHHAGAAPSSPTRSSGSGAGPSITIG
jgi:hypothetical protein